MTHYTIPKPVHGSQEWLNIRWATETGEKRITASVAAAVHGEHKYVTAGDLAAELLAPAPPSPKESSADMRRGTHLEDGLRKLASEELGVTIIEPEVLYCYDEPGVRLLSTIDGMSSTGAVFEIKTSRALFSGELPRYWHFQGVQQAICANVNRVEWVIFDAEFSLKFFTQEVSEIEKQQHIDACRIFLSYIDTYPEMKTLPPDITVSYSNASTVYPQSTGTSIELDPSVFDTLERLAFAQVQIKEGESAKLAAQSEIALALGDNEIGTVDGKTVVTWKTSMRTTFDDKAFAAAYPDMVKEFQKSKPVRTMRPTKGDK